MNRREKAEMWGWAKLIPGALILLTGLGFVAAKVGGTSIWWGAVIVLGVIVAVIVLLLCFALVGLGIEEIKANSGPCMHSWDYAYGDKKRRCHQCETYQEKSPNTDKWVDRPWKEAFTDLNWNLMPSNRTYTGGMAYPGFDANDHGGTE
jgi:hypothetical protein